MRYWVGQLICEYGSSKSNAIIIYSHIIILNKIEIIISIYVKNIKMDIYHSDTDPFLASNYNNNQKEKKKETTK
tara:strand:- start:411 stop:632 length:222 start_codon:yes stop_codon:yes gene_type:complete